MSDEILEPLLQCASCKKKTYNLAWRGLTGLMPAGYYCFECDTSVPKRFPGPFTNKPKPDWLPDCRCVHCDDISHPECKHCGGTGEVHSTISEYGKEVWEKITQYRKRIVQLEYQLLVKNRSGKVD